MFGNAAAIIRKRATGRLKGFSDGLFAYNTAFSHFESA